jgi:hypothetical protein
MPAMIPGLPCIEKLPATKSANNSGITWFPATDNEFSPVAGLLRITMVSGRSVKSQLSYVVSEFPADFPGRAFHLQKTERDTRKGADENNYSVFCSAMCPSNDLCECKGFVFSGKCKHLAGIRALLENEWL